MAFVAKFKWPIYKSIIIFLFIIVTILVTNDFLIRKLVSKLVIIVTNNFLSLKLIVNKEFLLLI